MADTTEPAGADPLAHTIYIWPSRELVARSWEWPEAWHDAYEHAASEVGREVAVHVLGGLAVCEQAIELALGAGRVSFTVGVIGTSIFVSITAFEGPEGPDSPGPGGGCEQPRSADGLILGLRGTGKGFVMVTFYGYLPPLPVGYSPAGLGPVLGSRTKGLANSRNDFGQPARYDRAVEMPARDAAVSSPITRSGARNENCHKPLGRPPWGGRADSRGCPCLHSGKAVMISRPVQTT